MLQPSTTRTPLRSLRLGQERPTKPIAGACTEDGAVSLVLKDLKADWNVGAA